MRIVFREGRGWCGKCVGAAHRRYRFRITTFLVPFYTQLYFILLHTEEMIFLAPSYRFDINISKYNISSLSTQRSREITYP